MKHALRSVVLLAVSIVLVLLLPSCSDVWDEDIRQIAFDSLSVPSTLSRDDGLCISTYGVIGNDGCWSFGYFDVERDSFQLVISAWAKMRSLHGTGCTQNVPLLGGKQYCTQDLFPGTLRVIGLQPDSTTITKEVIVTE